MASKVIGEWEVTTKSPLGTTVAIWNITEEADGSYKGTILSVADNEKGDFVINAIEGDNFDMNTKLKTPFGMIDFNMKGTATDTEITGEAKMKLGKSKFTGVRK
ncbi:MAG: hypothetical protein IJ106_08270 [Parasporobacterium sp.]|nr:hypothetical protein [Parasporobacterium sp.]